MYVIQCTKTGYINYLGGNGIGADSNRHDIWSTKGYFLGLVQPTSEIAMCKNVESRNVLFFSSRKAAEDSILYELLPSSYATMTAEFRVTKVIRTVKLAT